MMEIQPNPAFHLTIKTSDIKKKGFFINEKQIKQLRKGPQDAHQKVMFDHIDNAINLWQQKKNRPLTSINRGTVEGTAAVALSLLLYENKNLEKEFKTWIKRLLDSHQNLRDNPLDLGHFLITMAMVYQWSSAKLSKSLKKQMIEIVQLKGAGLFASTKTPRGYWAGTPLHNITHCAWCGLGLAGTAFLDDFPDARFWLNDAFHQFNNISWLQADDGSLLEGPSYSAYETEMRALFYELSISLLNISLYRKSHFGIADYFIHLHKPSAQPKNHIFTWGDSAKGIFVHSPVNLILGLAKFHQCSKLQKKALWILSKGFTKNAHFEWMNLLFYDPKFGISKKPLSHHHFHQDIGMINSRSSWQENATALSFKCGPFQGKKAKEIFSGDPGCSHAHADQGSLQLFSDGSDILIDPGYEAIKRTHHHNTLTLDHYGQLGEGSKWYGVNHALHYEHDGKILYHHQTKNELIIIADVCKAYVPEAQLTNYLRTTILLHSNILLVYDQATCATNRKFFVHWHTPLAVKKENALALDLTNQQTIWHFQAFSDQGPLKIKSKKNGYAELAHPFEGHQITLHTIKKEKTFSTLCVFSKEKIQIKHQANKTKISHQKKKIDVQWVTPHNSKIKITRK